MTNGADGAAGGGAVMPGITTPVGPTMAPGFKPMPGIGKLLATILVSTGQDNSVRRSFNDDGVAEMAM